MSAELLPLRWPDGWDDWKLLDSTPFNCVLVQGTQAGAPVRDGLRVLTQAPREVQVVKGAWPRVRSARDGGAAGAGPTGRPWVDANGWRIEIARAAKPGVPVWLDHAPPEGDVVTAKQRVRALAEAEGYGAHWIAVPGTPADIPVLAKAAAFFASHRQWRGWKPVAWVGLAADFNGPKKFLAGEFLNLSARRGLSVRIASPAEAGDFAALVTVGVKASGANVISADRYDDPYRLVQDVHLKIGRERDLIRLYNGGSINMHYFTDSGSKRGVIHLINYADGTDPITVSTKIKWRSAKIHTFTGGASLEMKPIPVRYGVEIPLPDFGVYAAVELEA
ncbi:MAG: hypothetical protein U0Q16_29315 [Bryobacteraceae bacterium]